MDHRLRLRSLLVERSLEVGDFTLSSGARSSYYIDARKTTMSSEGQFLVGSVAYGILRDSGRAGDLPPDLSWIGGLTLGADPISYAIAHRSWLEGDPIEAFTVRKRPKSHGLGRRIEGGLPSGVPVVVVEDSLTSGGSALEAVAVIEEHGATVAGVLTLVDREAGGGDAIRDAGYTFLSVYTAAELLESAGEPVAD